MVRPKNKHPIPFLRLKNGVWRVCWRWDGAAYEFSTGYREEDAAEKHRLESARALRGDADWPEWADKIEVVQKWKKTIAVAPSQSAIESSTALEAWRKHYASSISRAHQINTRVMEIQSLADRYDLLTLTPEQAGEFIRSLAKAAPQRYYSDQIVEVMAGRTMTRPEIIKAMITAGLEVDRRKLSSALINRNLFEVIAEKGHHRTGKYRARSDGRKLAPRTRNDYLIAVGQFYKWAVKERLVKSNPFDGIRRAREDHHTEIIWLTRIERDLITGAANALPCRVAVWVAIYAGLRLGEIARLRWEDVDLAGRWLHVKKSKTGKSRRVPVSAALLAVLQAEEKKAGVVVAHWQGERPAVKAESDLRLLAKSLPALADKIGWNIFRHTFASLLAQTGKVSIDQISALMGNTPEVCRRHYAHLIPDAVERTGIDLID